jgi:hypothetical protein
MNAMMLDVPVDPALDGLSELFPAEGAPSFVARTAEEMFGEPIDSLEMRVEYVRYWPAEGCIVLWSFAGPDGARRFVSGRLFGSDHGERVMKRSGFRRLARAVGPAGHRYLADRRLLLLAFPMDGRLSGLPAADSDDWVRDVVGPAVGIDPAEITGIERKALNFKPWRRCVFRYRLRHAGGTSAFYAKVFRDGRGETLYERSIAVHRHLDEAGVPWDTPRAVAYLPDEKVVVFEELPGGNELSDLLRQADRGGAARARLLAGMERAGAVPRDLRGIEVPGLRSVPPATVLADMRKRMGGIELVAPGFAAAIERSMAGLAGDSESRVPEPLVPTHAAFRHDQVLVRGDRVALLDFDGLCLSGASADAGYFLGYLDATALRRPRRRALLEESAAAFVYGMGKVDGTAEWLAWFRAAALVKKAVRSFLSLDGKWRAAAAALDAGAVEATLAGRRAA